MTNYHKQIAINPSILTASSPHVHVSSGSPTTDHDFEHSSISDNDRKILANIKIGHGEPIYHLPLTNIKYGPCHFNIFLSQNPTVTDYQYIYIADNPNGDIFSQVRHYEIILKSKESSDIFNRWFDKYYAKFNNNIEDIHSYILPFPPQKMENCYIQPVAKLFSLDPMVLNNNSSQMDTLIWLHQNMEGTVYFLKEGYLFFTSESDFVAFKLKFA